MNALIFGGKVIQIAATTFPVHSAMQWVAIPSGQTVDVGYSYSGGAFSAPAAPVLTLAQQAAAAISAGLTITLSGSITLAATLFPTDPVATGKIADVMTTVNTTGAFANGATSFPMKDSAGNWHTFTVSQYKAVATAIDNYVAPLVLIVDGNPLNATALPASGVALSV